MARVPIYDLTSAPEGSRSALERQSTRVGRTLNIFGAMANAPALIGMYDAVEMVLGSESSLGEPARQAIHLTVAAVNDCEYCQAAYTGAARANGFTIEQTIEIRKGFVSGRDELTALLRVAREIAKHRGHVSQRVWDAAQSAGWGHRQILEVYAEVIRTLLTNYFNHMVDTDLDLSPAPPMEPSLTGQRTTGEL